MCEQNNPAVVVTQFESRKVYQSKQRPSYTSWVSFFPDHEGNWYIGCEEVTRPQNPLPQCTPEQWFAMGLPAGYDKSQYHMEAVLLRSDAELNAWEVISRQSFRHHHAVGQFGTARTREGRLLRFVWAAYSLEKDIAPNQILYTSDDEGCTWQLQPGFHHPNFASHPHRLRTLRDGTLVLCVPLNERFGTPEKPVRTAVHLDRLGDKQMTMFFSFDNGHTWEGPLPILAGQKVSETDFVELPDGDLLVINNSIFAHPGRQRIYREGRRFTPGPLEKARGLTAPGEPNLVPETVCLVDNEILVGCMRAGDYQWSDDLGRTWYRLEGIPKVGPEVYQPWIYALPDGRIVCAGHYGRDAPIRGEKRDDQYVSLHVFEVEVQRHTQETRLVLERERAPGENRWRNRYLLRLLCGEAPVPHREIEFWYVKRNQPGYDSWGKVPLEERMELGGTLLRLRTDEEGRAVADLTELDSITDPHFSYQLVARFQPEASDSEYKPYQTLQFEFYCVSKQDAPLV
ncbi:MAG: sialidase family protein [bacterium]|nr:sialidase family protein [bacterium]